jgi:hypothetical protein
MASATWLHEKQTITGHMEQSERTDLGKSKLTEVKLKYPPVKSWYGYLT